jgi:2-hydroxychromene-2-carboxylate isomerase
MRFCCALEHKQSELFNFTRAAFDAYYTHQANLDDPEVLVDIANKLELNGEQLRALSQQQSIKDHLRANTDEAIARGGFGSPCIFVPFGDGERLYFGNDQLPLVEWAILQN